MSDLTRNQIEDDLLTQGIEDTSVDDVLASTGLYQQADPAWTYSTEPDEDVYAPTAGEMYPGLVPPEWPTGTTEGEPEQ